MNANWLAPDLLERPGEPIQYLRVAIDCQLSSLHPLCCRRYVVADTAWPREGPSHKHVAARLTVINGQRHLARSILIWYTR